MKRRTKRDLGILLGVVVILGGVVFFNATINRTALAREMEKLRRQVEDERLATGMRLLSWDLMRATKGNLRSGGNFDPDIFQYDDEPVNIVGFMVPQDQFRNVTEFLLLPLPLECYFCQRPPARDVMLVRLKEGETAQIYEEPILLNGTLNVHEGPTKFFYSITEASLGPGEMGGDLNKRRIPLEHMTGPDHGEGAEDQLLPPTLPETSSDTD